jgi:hypothetical protein
VLAFVDLGSDSMAVSPALFKELDVNPKASVALRIGKVLVDIDPGTVVSDSWLPFTLGSNGTVEAVLPAGVMRGHQVVIDYAVHTLTLARPGMLKLQGVPVPFRVHDKTGLIAVNATVDGKSYPITIDNGSAYTWIRRTAAQEWLSRHPEWERGTGAVGQSNMRMADDGIEASGTILRIADLQIGDLLFRDVGALAIGPGNTKADFMDWYSKKNAMPVIGWIGGNVLCGFRISIDYPKRVSYWLSEANLDPHDLDQVGLTLMFKQRQCIVAAIASQHGKPTVEGVQVGDKLVQIDSLRTSTATRSAILAAMHGNVGEVRALLLERNGKAFVIRARITGF